MSSSSRRVRFYEILDEAGNRVAPIDVDRHFFDVVNTLPTDAPQHWVGDSGVRVRGRSFVATHGGARPRTDMVILDRVHREPGFNYVSSGNYRDHTFPDQDTQFAEPKFLAFFERNIVATFTSGLRMSSVEACINTWRLSKGLQSIVLSPVVDTDRLTRLAEVDTVGRLSLALPAEVARRVYGTRQGPIASFFRSRAQRDGRINVELRVEVSDAEASDELRDELEWLMTDDVYQEIVASEGTVVEATYYTDEDQRGRQHNFLGQALAITVQVEVPEPEQGPQPWSASEGLMQAFNNRRDRLLQTVPGED